MKVLGIIASLRRRSASEQCLQLVKGWTPMEAVQWSLFDPRVSTLPFCDGREDQKSYPQSVETLRNQVSTTDRILFIAPTHNGTFSAVAKNIVELLGPDYLSGKRVGVIAVSGEDEASAAARDMATVLLHCGCEVVPVLGRLPFADRLINNLEAPFARLYVQQLKALMSALVGEDAIGSASSS